MTMSLDLTALSHVAVAALGGLAIGIERQWSGHAEGPNRRFGGMRTFTLLGIVAGVSGWLWTAGFGPLAVVLLAGPVLLVAIGYAAASRTDVEATTEVAALVVLTAGVLAGTGALRISSALVAATVLLLVEKTRLHTWVKRLDDIEISAGARFGVLAAVVLPLLPTGPYGPLGGIQPRALWMLVLFLSGLSFCGYIARRLVGRSRGYAIAGLLGGLVSSTSVTLGLAQVSRREPPGVGRSLAAGTLAASVVMFPRVLLVTAVLYAPVARALWPLFVLPVAIGIFLGSRGLRPAEPTDPRIGKEDNPLQLGAALKLAAFFQVVLFGVAYAQQTFGQSGLYVSAAIIGLTEVDALTISMAAAAAHGTPIDVAARAIAIGVLANTATKLGITIVTGRGTFRPLAATGLALMGAALIAGLWYWS
jgi:uncharacterized membrane protein (DUF4010 family)